jgi:hypothetical protein
VLKTATKTATNRTMNLDGLNIRSPYLISLFTIYFPSVAIFFVQDIDTKYPSQSYSGCITDGK